MRFQSLGGTVSVDYRARTRCTGMRWADIRDVGRFDDADCDGRNLGGDTR